MSIIVVGDMLAEISRPIVYRPSRPSGGISGEGNDHLVNTVGNYHLINTYFDADEFAGISSIR